MLRQCQRQLGLLTLSQNTACRHATRTLSSSSRPKTNALSDNDATLLHLGPPRKQTITAEPTVAITSRKLPTSLKKLGNLARQIQHKPLTHAVLQMQFSDKRHAPHIAAVLENARRGAISKGMDAESLFVDQAWVTKGKYVRRLFIKGRARLAIQRRPRVGIDVVVKDKTTADRRALETAVKKEKKVLRGLTVPNRPIYTSTMFTA